MKRPYLLALDLGTTGNRAIVLDRDQRIVCKSYQEFRQIYPRPGWVEHDAEAIWKSVHFILKKTFARVAPEKIAAVGITNQRETIVVWDRRTGRPVHPAIVWQCRRTASLCQHLKRAGLEKSIHRKTGLRLDPYFSGTKLRWLFENVPGLSARAAHGDLLAGTMDTWIVWKLSGGRSHVTDSSNASRTLLFDIHKKSWDSELCRVFKTPRAILPVVVASSAEAGFLDRKLFGREIPICGIAGDQQAAAFAQGCFAPGIVKNTYGTGLFMIENTGHTVRYSRDLLTTVAWSLGSLKHTEYALEGSVFIGGAAIQWLRDGLGILKNAQDSQALAQTLSSNEGVYFVPALVGLGAPYWDTAARGTILGITRGTTRAHLARAALESLAYQTRDVMEVMRRDAHRSFKVLRVDGGASANDFLMQFQADVLGVPVERPCVLETTALGAAGLAGLVTGFWKDKEEFNARRKVDRMFRPRAKKQKKLERSYSRWKEAVKRSRAWA